MVRQLEIQADRDSSQTVRDSSSRGIRQIEIQAVRDSDR